MKNNDSIWITGVGCATPLGLDFGTLSKNLLEGRSGIAQVSQFCVEDHPCKIAAKLPPLPAPDGWNGDDFSRRDQLDQLLLYCAVNALRDAGYWEDRQNLRIGLVVGIGCEWPQYWERDFHDGGDAIHRPEENHAGGVQKLKAALGLTGPSSTVAAACASGNIALGVARQWLHLDWVDVCLAGGVDIGATQLGLACFGNLGTLSKRQDDPTRACRPFDRDRDGFVIGEGGALLVLESKQRARRRSARAYGEVLGFGASSDAFNQVMPNKDPEPASRAVTAALKEARVHRADINYINAHATSTLLADLFETKVLHRSFGESILKIPVSGTKSMTGHMLSAASAVQAVICLTSFQAQAVPPTINLDNPDPECNLLHVANHAQPRKVDVALSNSFGFGGCNTALVLRRV